MPIRSHVIEPLFIVMFAFPSTFWYKPCTVAPINDVQLVSSDVASDAKKRRKSLKAPLPPGWKKVKDPESGHSYYFHQTTKQTTWKRPKLEEETEAEAPPPPPPPPPEEEMPPPPPPDEAATIEPPPPPPDSNTDEPPPPPPDE